MAEGDVYKWDDQRFPAVGERIGGAGGRITYDYDEGVLEFAANARYADEFVGIVVQTPHAWVEGSSISPHLHWVQSEAAVPNMLMEYRSYNNGDEVPSTYTLAITDNDVFPYPGSGSIMQISSFPDIPMSTLRISCIMDVKLYRDSANASGLFRGADPYTVAWSLKEFDIHMQIDSLGSIGLFDKNTEATAAS